MNKTAIIIGGLVVIGVGAYFVLKPKKEIVKTTSLLGANETTSPTGGTSSMGDSQTQQTQAPTPQVAMDSAKEMEADGLATQILGLKKQRLGLMSETLLDSPSSIFGTSAFGIKITSGIRQSQINALTSKINTLIAKLKTLGYKEVEGKAVKLVAVTTTKFV
jgi:hypothetical protein